MVGEQGLRIQQKDDSLAVGPVSHLPEEIGIHPAHFSRGVRDRVLGQTFHGVNLVNGQGQMLPAVGQHNGDFLLRFAKSGLRFRKQVDHRAQIALLRALDHGLGQVVFALFSAFQDGIREGVDAVVRQLETTHHRSKTNILRLVTVIPLAEGTLGGIPRQGERASVGDGRQKLLQPEDMVLLPRDQHGNHRLDLLEG